MIAGYQDMELDVECSQSELRIQAEKSPPAVHRLLDYDIDVSKPVESIRCDLPANVTLPSKADWPTPREVMNANQW